jgi:hypothetical protein
VLEFLAQTALIVFILSMLAPFFVVGVSILSVMIAAIRRDGWLNFCGRVVKIWAKDAPKGDQNGSQDHPLP